MRCWILLLRLGEDFQSSMKLMAEVKAAQPEPSEEYLNDWLVRTCEIIDRYDPGILYFDWWIQHENVKPWLKKFTAYYYNRSEVWTGANHTPTLKEGEFVFLVDWK